MDSIALKQLAGVIANKLKSGIVEEEYNELEQVPPAPGCEDKQHDAMVKQGLCEEAVKNESKNRYCNLFPFDRNLVKLPHGYINASWILFDDADHKYVITMAPLDGSGGGTNTCQDFWSMCWEIKAKAVVMMCTVDKGFSGCPQYFPHSVSESILNGCLVENTKTNVERHHVDRTFRISSNDESTITNHLQYTAWPNYGVPNDISSIGNFVKHVYHKTSEIYNESGYQSESPYLIIHCSGGVGRSGAFLTMFKAYSDLVAAKKKGAIPDCLPLKDVVMTMRHHRHPWMVEGLHQYQLIYDVMAYLIQDLIDSS